MQTHVWGWSLVPLCFASEWYLCTTKISSSQHAMNKAFLYHYFYKFLICSAGAIPFFFGSAHELFRSEMLWSQIRYDIIGKWSWKIVIFLYGLFCVIFFCIFPGANVPLLTWRKWLDTSLVTVVYLIATPVSIQFQDVNLKIENWKVC